MDVQKTGLTFESRKKILLEYMRKLLSDSVFEQDSYVETCDA